MTRIIAIFVKTIILYAFADFVCGSLHYFPDYARARLPRYATCTSCNREWADAFLTSSWNPEEKHNEVPIDQEYLGINERYYNRQIPSSLSTNLDPTNLDSLKKNENSLKRENDNPTMLYSERRNFYQRDADSFENRESTKFNPHFIFKTSTPSSKQEGILNQYPFILTPQSDINRRSLNRNYQLARRFSEFDNQQIRNVENEKEYRFDRSNRLNNEIPFRKVESFLKEEDTKDYKPSKKFSVVYRADQDRRMFEQDDDTSIFEKSTDLFKESNIPRSYEKIDQSVFNVDQNSYSRSNPSRNKMIDNNDWSNKLLQNDYLIHNYHNFPKESDVTKTVQFIDRDQLFPDRKEIVSFRQLDQDKSLENLSSDKDYKMKGSVKNGGHFLGRHDITNNEKEKLLAMQAVKIFNMEDDSTKEESSFKFDPDFIDDIEYPFAEPTKPTSIDESTESSMMTQN